MKPSLIGLGAVSGALPMVMGFNLQAHGEDLPSWLILVISACGPAFLAILFGGSKAAAKAVIAYFRGKSEEKLRRAELKLKDKDKSNDEQAEKELVEAKAELKAAESLEKGLDAIVVAKGKK
jgi:hypothetical protein